MRCLQQQSQAVKSVAMAKAKSQEVHASHQPGRWTTAPVPDLHRHPLLNAVRTYCIIVSRLLLLALLDIIAMAARHGSKDFYKTLNVGRSASKKDIKDAYRKLALALHPDRHDGCDTKAEEFKALNEAYDTLSDNSKRSAYDTLSGFTDGNYNRNRRTAPPPNYRKVYSPRAPPGMKTFDEKRHFDMHYGDGMMREELDRVERARRRAEAASGRKSGYDYRSPLGQGFGFDEGWTENPYSRRPQGPPKENGAEEIEYEQSHFFDLSHSSNLNKANRVVQKREVLRNRMAERRKGRRRQRGDPLPNYEEESGCTVM